MSRFRTGDTQTTSNTWQIGINGPILRNYLGNTYLKNSTDDGYSSLTLQNLTVLGTALIPVDTSSFTGILTAAENTVQKAFVKIDKHNHSHNSLTGILGDGYYHISSAELSALHTQNTDTGTTSQTFVVYSGAQSLTLKSVNDGYGYGSLEVRNAVGFADLSVNNLNVFGTRTILHSTTVTIDDNIILLNSNVVGAPVLNAGFEVKRGASTNSTILWDENSDSWKVGLVGSEVEITTISGTQTLTNKTLTAPVIASFISAQHNHQDGYDGGKLDINNATTGTLLTTRGGTGLISYVTGSLLYSSATNTLASLPISIDGYVLTAKTGLPAWSPVSSLTQQASNISVVTTLFNNILSVSDTNVQKALDTIDDHNHSHNSLIGILGDGYYHISLAQRTALHSQNTDTGTSNNSFSIGNGVDTDKTIIANNGDAYLPTIKYSAINNRWEVSDNGISFDPISSGDIIDYIQVGKDGVLTPGETNYLTTSYVESDIATMGYLVNKACTIRSLRIKVGVAPGVGQTVQFTVAINGVDSALTVSLAGTNTTALDSTHTATLFLGDTVNVKVVSSVSSVTENVMVSMELIK